MALPEVLHAEAEPAGGPAEVREAGGAAALVGGHPAVVFLGALPDREALAVELGERVVAPRGDPVQPGRDPLVPCGRVGQGPARDLRFPHGRTGVAAQAGDALDRLGELPVAIADEPDVPVVELIGEHDLEPDPEAGDEGVFTVGVVDEGVHHAEGLAARVEVEADGERQPGLVAALGLAVVARHLHDGAHRPVLLDHHLVDLAGVAVARDRSGLGVGGLVLGDVDQVPVRDDGATCALDVFDQVGAALVDPGGDDAGVDVDVLLRLGHGDRERGGRGLPGAEREALGGGGRADGVAGPLQGAVRPVGEGPGLHRDRRAVVGDHLEPLVLREPSRSPRDAPGRARGFGRPAFEPAQVHRVGAGVFGRARLGVCGGGFEERGGGGDARGGGEDAAAAHSAGGVGFVCRGKAGQDASKGSTAPGEMGPARGKTF